MSEHVVLDENTRATLERLVQDRGMSTVAEHTGLSERVIAHAINKEGSGIKPKQVAAIEDYLKGRV